MYLVNLQVVAQSGVSVQVTRTHLASAQTSKAHNILQALQDIWREHGLESDPLLARLSQIPSLTLTIWDSGPTSVPCQDLGNMTLTEFAELYSVSPMPLA